MRATATSTVTARTAPAPCSGATSTTHASVSPRACARRSSARCSARAADRASRSSGRFSGRSTTAHRRLDVARHGLPGARRPADRSGLPGRYRDVSGARRLPGQRDAVRAPRVARSARRRRSRSRRCSSPPPATKAGATTTRTSKWRSRRPRRPKGMVSVAALAAGAQGFTVAPFLERRRAGGGPWRGGHVRARGGGLVSMSGTSMATPHVGRRRRALGAEAQGGQSVDDGESHDAARSRPARPTGMVGGLRSGGRRRRHGQGAAGLGGEQGTGTGTGNRDRGSGIERRTWDELRTWDQGRPRTRDSPRTKTEGPRTCEQHSCRSLGRCGRGVPGARRVPLRGQLHGWPQRILPRRGDHGARRPRHRGDGRPRAAVGDGCTCAAFRTPMRRG